MLCVHTPPVAAGGGYYGTIAVVDHAVECLREHARRFAEQPFFQYIAFAAPHFPLHALPEDAIIYRNRYAPGERHCYR